MNDYNELTRELLNAASHKLLEDTEDYIFAVDEALIYRAASDSVARMAGIDSAAAIIGRSDYDIFPVELAEKYRADDLRVMETGEPLEGIVERLPDLDGKPRWTKTWKSPVYSKSGRLLGLFGLSRDVTRIRSLEKTEKMAQRYAQLISNMPGGVGIIHIEDGEFVLDFANEGWARAHHHRYVSTNELIGRHLIEDIFDDDRELVRHEYEEVLEQRKTQGRVIYRAPGDDGKLHWVSALFRFAYESNGIRYYYASYTGMDEQKSAEAALLDSQSALREAVENSDIQFFTCFPEEKRCELYAVNSRLSQLPMTWKDFPDDFLEYTMATAEDAEAYRDMLRQIDEGADEAGCTVRFCYKGVYNWEKIIVKAVRDERGKTVKVQGYSINVNEKIGDEERYKASQLKSSVLDGNIFETFTLNLTGNSVIDIRTKDPAMLEQEITEDVLRDAFSICPALRESSSETRSVLLRAALRIPDKDEREMFIRKCSGDGVKKMINDGRRTMRIRYRRYVGEQIRWVSSSLEILNDPQSDDLTAFFYTTDITGDVMDDMLSKQIMQLNYETVSYCDLQTGELIIKDTKYEDTRQVSGRKYQEAMEWLSEKMENSGEFLKKFRLENLQAQLEATRTVTLYYAKKEKRRDLPGSPTKQLKCDIFYLDDNQDMLVFLISDITEIIENERENKEKMAGALIAARQASEAKSNFLSRMSHEIRTPLNAIIGMDTIAAQAIGNTEKVADCISKIGLSARYLLSLVNDILDMSRIESGKMLLKNESFAFAEFISSVNTIIFPQVRSKGLDYECTVSSEVEEMYCGDEMKLQQILVNVMGNAVKFTSRGRITLDISVISQNKGTDRLRFVVNDTGCGIPEENLELIFDAFEQVDTSTTTVFGGTGLGLAITRNLVELMGGNINVRSIVDIGSEFTIDIPLEAGETMVRPSPLVMNLKNMNALIVDDDLIICEQAYNVLKDIGMVGEWVTTGHEALERVRLKSDEGSFYDFILIDWKMPDMDGIETTRSIRQLVGPDVTIIIISAYDWQSIEAEARAAGANLMISKPLLKSTLVSAFEKAIGGDNAGQELDMEFDFSGRRALLVEDNELNAEIARTLLESKHFTVETAANGIKALEMFVKNPADYYDVILMDVRMPVMDGLQATVNIRHWDKPDAATVPIVAMTANAFDEDVEKSRSAGMNAHLSKPIDPDVMYSTLYRLLERES